MGYNSVDRSLLFWKDSLPSPQGFSSIPYGHYHMLATLASYAKLGLIMALDTHCLNTIQHQKPLPKLAVARRERNDRETQEQNMDQNEPDCFSKETETLGFLHRAGINEASS